MKSFIHKPVFFNNIKCIFNNLSTADSICVDATMGYGGHLSSILEFKALKLCLGFDRDLDAFLYCRKKFSKIEDGFLQLFNLPFSNLEMVLNNQKISCFNALLADLGVSSYQLDTAKRGFSYRMDAPLDMRMNQEDPKNAADLLKTYSKDQLLDMFKKHSDLYRIEPFVERLVDCRAQKPILSTFDLISHIKKSFYFRGSRRRYLSTCAQVFQALRMEVNQELNEIEELLKTVKTRLSPGGFACFITFHSIEDRLVKRFFKVNSEFSLYRNKIIKPTQADIKENPRAKSAKLRVYVRDEA